MYKRQRQEGDRTFYSVEGTDDVLAVPYDIPIVGYGGETVNKLRCWSACLLYTSRCV